MLNIEKATRKELMQLPEKPWNCSRTYDSILLFPSRKKHSSGYAKMIIIGVIGGNAVEIAANMPDDLNWHSPNEFNNGRYSIANLRTDCMHKNGGLHFWRREHNFIVGSELSSIDISIIPVPEIA